MGLGYRAQALKAVMGRMAEFECVGWVLHKQRTAAVPVYTDLGQCLDEVGAEFVLNLAPTHSAAAVLDVAITHGVPVLTGAPPASTIAEVERLADAASSGLVQASEHHPLMPGHQARLTGVEHDMIGEVFQVQISATDPCHAMALMRAYLGLGIVPAVVRGHRFSNEDILASVDFGDGRSGIYDFTNNQTRVMLQAGRLLVRGSHGEISGDQVVRLGEHNLITTTYMQRHLDPDTGSTSQITLGDHVLWTNPTPEMGWNDDEVAIAEFLTRTSSWVRGEGAAPYPLKEAMDDARLSLAITEAIEQDRTVEVPANLKI